MNIKKIVEAIKAAKLENGDDLVTGIENLYHTLNDENKTLRKAKESTVSKIREASGADTDDLEAILTALQDKQSPSKSLERKFSKMEEKLKLMEKEKGDLELSSKRKDRDANISKLLLEKGVRKDAVNGLQKMFGALSKLDEDGQEWLIDDDSISDGVGKYLENNSYVLDANQKKGSGSKKPEGNKTKKEYLSNAEVQEMSPSERKDNIALIRSSRAKAAEENREW